MQNTFTLSAVSRLLGLATAILFLSITACRKEDPSTPTNLSTNEFEAEVATRWFDRLRQLTSATPGFTPPVASRAFGYAGVALYESVVQGSNSSHRSLAFQLNGLPEMPHIESGKTYHWPIVANAAMAYMAQNLYANATEAEKSANAALERDLQTTLYQSTDAEMLERSKAHGQAIARLIFEWSKKDGAHEPYKSNFPTTYQFPVGPTFWRPEVAGTYPLQPYWGSNRSFVPNSIDHSQPFKPSDFATEKNTSFYQQMLEVYTTVINLTEEQKTIARFWSDDPGIGGTPPGHSISIAGIVVRKEKANLMVAAETYARVGIAVADAFIACWKCKFTYHTPRPVTYIGDNIASNWKPLLATPPFPDYISGHATQGGATAQVLSEMFGYNYVFTDDTHAKRSDIDGRPRVYHSFYEAAEEAALSRMLGGIHIRESNERGIVTGRKIGNAVNALRWRL